MQDDVETICQTACDAIRRRRVARLTYDPSTVPRLIEAHALGVSAGGELFLFAWQHLGSSSSGAHAGWKTFLIRRIRSLSLDENAKFPGPRPDYRAGWHGLAEILCEISE